jgi:hypothetical protein
LVDAGYVDHIVDHVVDPLDRRKAQLRLSDAERKAALHGLTLLGKAAVAFSRNIPMANTAILPK